jgi:pre-rRNA-processing protein TSR3
MIAEMVPRSLPPSLRTAYPRRQTLCPDPARGLASVEALFAAYRILGRDVDGILDGYLWRERFLVTNALRSPPFTDRSAV